ncbi:MAG: chromate transporter [Chthoniobacterales bacterium]|nr:MAG: chromate transporter [Chthoniobacterales bacterium]
MTGEDACLPAEHPAFREAFLFWLKLGFISFGGPAGQIAIMQTELVDRRRWISQSRFLHALNFCMLLPGPEATQLAIYVGWLLHRTIGGIVAGALFVIPSMFVLWTLSYIYVRFGNVPVIAAIFYGLKPAVTAIVLAALGRIGRRALNNATMWSIALTAFVAIYFFKVPFPLIILGAACVGFVGRFFWTFTAEHDYSPLVNERPSNHSPLSLRRAILIIVTCMTLWLTPTLLAGFARGWQSTLFREGVFFSKAAVVTFGGAYAVLPYVAQQAMFHYSWLRPGQMMDGLALAETTPGPLIMVVQFVGFVGAWQDPDDLPPLLAATLGALITTWVTFVPCFLWVFLGAPYIERLRGNVRLTAALSGITAAVVGVVLNLAVWFSLRVFLPGDRSVDAFAIAITAVAFFGLLKWRWNVVAVVLGAGAAGLIWRQMIDGTL